MSQRWVEVLDPYPVRGVEASFLDLNLATKVEVFGHPDLGGKFGVWVYVGPTCYTLVEKFDSVGDVRKLLFPDN